MKRVVAAVLAAALLVLTSGCSDGDDAGDAPASATPTVDPGPPLEVGDRLWGTKETGLTALEAFEPRGDRTIVAGYGEYAEADTHVLGVDTTTGHVDWRLTIGDAVPGADGDSLWDQQVGVGAAGLPVVVSAYRSGGTDPRAAQIVLAGLDPDTGREVWTWDGARGHDLDLPTVDVIDATDDAVIVNLTEPTAGTARTRVVAIDLRTGELVWQHRGVTATAVADGMVLVGGATGGEVTDLEALDADDGTVTWQRDDEPERLAGLADGLALVAAFDGGDQTVVDLATGESLLDVSTDAAAAPIANDFGSRRAPGEFVAWLDDDDHLVTFAADDDEPSTSQEEVAAPLFAVVGDQVTHLGPGDDGVRTQGVVDRSGAPADISGIGVLFYSDGDLVVTGQYSSSFEVSSQT